MVLLVLFISKFFHFVSFADSIFNDVQFEDVSNSRKAFCWKYFLYANVKPNQKAKCQVEISKGEYCNKIFCATRGSTSALNTHLKNAHGINELSSFLGLDSNLWIEKKNCHILEIKVDLLVLSFVYLLFFKIKVVNIVFIRRGCRTILEWSWLGRVLWPLWISFVLNFRTR